MKSPCSINIFATILFSSVLLPRTQSADTSSICALDPNHPFLGKPVFDVQRNLTPDTGEAEIDGKKVPIYRSASLLIAQDGSILLFWSQNEKGHIYTRRSEDGGKTWGSSITVGKLIEIDDTYAREPRHFGRTILGSSMVDETTGDVLVFTSAFNPAPVLHRSRDHGKTWKTESITIKKDKNGWLPCFNAACVPGATLRHGPNKGRLLMPTRVFVHNLNYDPKDGPKVFDKHYTNAAYSDDHGKTWTPSEPFPLGGTGEAGLVEMLDGRIYINSRTHIRGGNRRIAWSTNSGQTWENEQECKFLTDGPPDVYGCKGGLVRLPIDDRDVLIYSSPESPHTTHRKPITVRASFDGAKTWPVARTLPDKEIAGYTWLGAGRPGTPSEGTIFLLAQTRYLVRFNLAWMLEENSTSASNTKEEWNVAFEPPTTDTHPLQVLQN
ncbi:MAG TPA: exo-alpha-sialidase [Alphaproteobacteria bacterium]|nr:exo-alpha-sialidase [Alphaproteobacteria bacterium]